MKSGNVPRVNSVKGMIQIFYVTKLCFISWFFQLYGPYYEKGPKTSNLIGDFTGTLFSSTTSLYFLGILDFLLISIIFIRPLNKTLKITEAFIALFFSALIYQSHKLGHSFNIFLLCSFFFAFLSESNKEKTIKQMLNLSLSIYFCAGIWKLIGLVLSLSKGHGVGAFKGLILEHSSRKAILLGYQNPVLNLLLVMPDFVHIIMGLSIICFQLYMIVPIIKNTYSQYLGVLLILFHLGGQIILDVNFIETQVLLGILFFLGLPLIEDTDAKDLA